MSEHTLTLTAEECEALARAIKTTLSNLSYEIADTDSHDFKESLKEYRARLQAVSERLPQAD